MQRYGSVRGFSGSAWTEQGCVQTRQTSASEGKIHTEKCCNVSGELIYVPFRAALWAAFIHNVRSPREALPSPPLSPLFYIQPLWRLGLCECLF